MRPAPAGAIRIQAEKTLMPRCTCVQLTHNSSLTHSSQLAARSSPSQLTCSLRTSSTGGTNSWRSDQGAAVGEDDLGLSVGDRSSFGGSAWREIRHQPHADGNAVAGKHGRGKAGLGRLGPGRAGPGRTQSGAGARRGQPRSTCIVAFGPRFSLHSTAFGSPGLFIVYP